MAWTRLSLELQPLALKTPGPLASRAGARGRNRGAIAAAVAQMLAESAICRAADHKGDVRGAGEAFQGAEEDVDGAEDACREAIRLQPDHAESHVKLGCLLIGRKRDVEGAERAFREAIRLQPDSAEAHYSMGALLFGHTTDVDGAEESFQEAIRLQPKHSMARYSLGLLLLGHPGNGGNADGAAGAHRETIRLQPDVAQARAQQGSDLLARGGAAAEAGPAAETAKLDYTCSRRRRRLHALAEPETRAARRAAERAPCAAAGGRLRAATRGLLGAARGLRSKVLQAVVGESALEPPSAKLTMQEILDKIDLFVSDFTDSESEASDRRGDEEETELATEEVTGATAAVRQVLKNALVAGGVVRGFREVCRHVRGKRAQVVFLAESCDEQDKIDIGLCLEKNVPLIDVPDNKSLGEWAGLCRIDKERPVLPRAGSGRPPVQPGPLFPSSPLPSPPPPASSLVPPPACSLLPASSSSSLATLLLLLLPPPPAPLCSYAL
ncbi:unnamed protein product [Prorocentrum cordatum]|uniref:40S ribosomal protein S12 n=1 Tax=Prorocentrum cordatum TaxID=2364126 RepID=A0ABN9W3U4_9DINO|nr:unnamed protein product [Polarella glacialis]